MLAVKELVLIKVATINYYSAKEKICDQLELQALCSTFFFLIKKILHLHNSTVTYMIKSVDVTYMIIQRT